jgi:hypothetical protein
MLDIKVVNVQLENNTFPQLLNIFAVLVDRGFFVY